jgi:NAD(P)H-dependent FMN reductase
MKCCIFNGSPRGKNSNSSVIIRWLLENVSSDPSISTEEFSLANTAEHKAYAAQMAEADVSVIVFPLYADSMPGIVAAFIEELCPYTGKMKGKKLAFEVHSGFLEANHSRYVEKYLQQLSRLLGADYMGTIITGDSEAIRLMPDTMQKKRKALYNKIGESIFKNGIFDSKSAIKLVRTEKLTGLRRLLYKTVLTTRFANMYWDSELKKNNAYEKRLARPYSDT